MDDIQQKGLLRRQVLSREISHSTSHRSVKDNARVPHTGWHVRAIQTSMTSGRATCQQLARSARVMWHGRASPVMRRDLNFPHGYFRGYLVFFSQTSF